MVSDLYKDDLYKDLYKDACLYARMRASHSRSSCSCSLEKNNQEKIDIAMGGKVALPRGSRAVKELIYCNARKETLSASSHYFNGTKNKLFPNNRRDTVKLALNKVFPNNRRVTVKLALNKLFPK